MKPNACYVQENPGLVLWLLKCAKGRLKIILELATVTDSQLAGNTCYQYGYVEDYKIVDRGNTDPIQFGRMYDELGWEFAWEMHRRRDAIRFGIYTTKSWVISQA